MLYQLIKKIVEFGLFILCVTFFTACSRTPRGVIPEKKMRNVLVDMHLAEAMINMNPKDYNSVEDKKALYQSVFEKYNLKEAEYDSSLIWYGKNLDLYMRIHNLSLADVKKRIEAMGDVKPEAVSVLDQDSVDIWMYQKYYEFSPLALSNLIIFDFKPNREYSSGSTFILNFRVWGTNSSMAQPIDLLLKADQRDTTLVVRSSINKNGVHMLTLNTLPNDRVKRVYGYIRLRDTHSFVYHKIYLDDFQLMKFNYESPYLKKQDSLNIIK